MYVAVDGYLLQSVDGETNYKIVSFKNARYKMSEADQEQFEKEELVDIDSYRSQENDLFYCTSKRLFEMIPAQQRLFYEQMEPRATKVVTARTSAKCKRSSTSKPVITITYKANVKKFLCYSKTGFDRFTFEMPTGLRYGTRERTKAKDRQLCRPHPRRLDLGRQQPPFWTADAKSFKRNCHVWEGFSDIFFLLGFTGSALNNLFLYGIDIHFCPWEVCTVYGKCKDCWKDRDLCLCPQPAGTPETKDKWYRRIGIEVLAVYRLLLDDEGYKEHLEIIEPHYEDLFPYLDAFYQLKKDIYTKILLTYSWYLDLVSSTKPIRALESERGVRMSDVLSKTAKEIYDSYSRLWHKLKEQKTNVPLLFFNFEWDALDTIWKLDEDRSDELVECPEIERLFGRIRSQSSCRFQGPGYLKEQFLDQHITRKQDYQLSKIELDYRMDLSSFPHWNLYLLMQIGLFYNAALMRQVALLLEQVEEVRLFPHWLALQRVRVEMRDGQEVPLYMLVVAIFLEMIESRST